jgi:hypothetical protein
MVVKAVPESAKALKPCVGPLNNKAVFALLRIVAVEMKSIRMIYLFGVRALGKVGFQAMMKGELAKVF